MRQKASTKAVHLHVKELAEQKRIGDLELAGRAGVDIRVIRRMFAQQGVGALLLSQLMRVADALEVDVCDLFEVSQRE
jgi:hypothetical protein